MMDTQKLTYGGMLSALIVTITLFVAVTGIGYTVYLDLALPILIGLVYMKCGLKYTSLCGVISVSISFFCLGNLPTALWMIQGVLIGLLCSMAIFRNSTLMDDFLWCSVSGAFILIFMDIYCESLLGMSIIKELRQSLEFLPVSNEAKEMAVSIGLATLPVGTSLVAYTGILLVGSRLNLLKGVAKGKFKMIKYFKSYGGYLCCSRNITNRWIIYLICIQILLLFQWPLFIRTLLITIQWIALYFILRDAYQFVGKYIYIKTQSIGITKGMNLSIFLMLLIRFKMTVIFLVLASFLVDIVYHVREKQIKFLKHHIA